MTKNYEVATTIVCNPYSIDNLGEFLFLSPEAFDKEKSHPLRDNRYLIVVDPNKVTDSEGYKKFVAGFATWFDCDTKLLNDDITLCFIVGYDREDNKITRTSKYFNVGIYSFDVGYPLDEREIYLDKEIVGWEGLVKAYSKILKDFGKEDE